MVRKASTTVAVASGGTGTMTVAQKSTTTATCSADFVGHCTPTKTKIIDTARRSEEAA